MTPLVSAKPDNAVNAANSGQALMAPKAGVVQIREEEQGMKTTIQQISGIPFLNSQVRAWDIRKPLNVGQNTQSLVVQLFASQLREC